MQDLSQHVFPYGNDPISALVPNSMAGGNMQSSSRFAMTAPGGVPVDPLPPAQEQGDPRIDATAYDTPVLRGPDGASVHPDNATRANPFQVADDAGWDSGRDSAEPDVLPEARGKPRIVPGTWNEL